MKRQGDDRPRTLLVATGFGVASSFMLLCGGGSRPRSVQAWSQLHSRKAFEIASTNLVVELGVILAVLIGWQFTLAEFVGGPIMIVLIAVVFRLFLRQRLIDDARIQSERGLTGSMEGHAAIDVTISEQGSLRHRLQSKEAVTAVSHIFIMEWAVVIRDIVLGLLIAGAIAAWVPDSFWHRLFVVDHPLLSKVWGPDRADRQPYELCVFHRQCPPGGVLWNAGISFGGVISFLFADLIILPILAIYKKYYGTKMMLFILASFYATMVVAGYIVEIVFSLLGLVPTERNAKVGETPIQWNYTTVLNIVALLLAAGLSYRFV